MRNPDTFGTNLRRIRKHHKLTQSQLAVMAKVSTYTILKIERFNVGPSLYTALQICDALEVEIGEMVDEPVTGVIESKLKIINKLEGKSNEK